MKKILLSLLGIITLGLINFGNGYTVPIPDGINTLTTEQIDWLNNNAIMHGINGFDGSVIELYDFGNESSSTPRNLCVILSGFSRSSDFGWNLKFISSLTTQSNGQYYDINQVSLLCASGWRRYFTMVSTSSSNRLHIGEFWVISPYDLFSFFGDLNSCSSELTTCQSDLNTCQNSSCQSELTQCQNDYSSCSNSLGTCGTQLNSCNTALGNCMQGNVGTGINWSSLFINGIQHVGKPLINITIPEEINWDYVNSGTVFDLTVSGYNQDSDYIEGLINIQNVKPSNEDLNKIISEIIPLFVPGLLIILFIYFVFRFIKKIF